MLMPTHQRYVQVKLKIPLEEKEKILKDLNLAYTGSFIDLEVDGKKYANKNLKQYYKGMYEQ